MQTETASGVVPGGRAPQGRPVIRLSEASLAFGERTLWSGLNLSVAPGEYFAVLGSNGTGKTSFLKVLLGLLPLTSGTVSVNGTRPRAAASRVGYVPQQRGFPARTPLRAKDLVAQGVDGHRWGIRTHPRRVHRRVAELLERVGASEYADAPVGLLSGGEQQRLRIAQALAADPTVMLCDEALLSLDLHHQHVVSELVHEQRERTGCAVVFVTHDVNPIIGHVDRILYLANGSFRIGTPDEVLRSDVLSELYGTHIEVLRSNGRILVAGRPDSTHHTDSPEELIP
ncbi:metal ABC transporter ATP-binding protein [Kocuria tytonicola]|uniref:Metal ABC transporter ATP-binding protein n=1 Tax=Kocuria tytonicola TaxID=2055946 RepID=A0A3L9L737_9MICC|nr:metal ABC transporter ATP-binding protein [Kocuria tytonicola]RLY94640.1 metal ABC transporter ATP-binding protein [Kocuria tytonicola]